MLASPVGPVEAALRRQSDTYKDPGLDYSTCLRIEDGTPSPIRSLFRPSHAYYPSHTPWPSDEMATGHLEDYETFDFNTAKSVAKSARSNSNVLSLPSKLVPKLPYVPEILQGSSKKQRAVTRISIRKPRAPHTSLDGADGIVADHATNDTLIHGTSFTCCTACPPNKRGKKALGWRRNASYTGITLGYKDDASVPSSSEFTHDIKATDVLVNSVHSVSIGERHSSLPGPSIRLVGSHPSLQLKSRAPSLETAASKNSAHRHALLKSSVIAGQAIDIGLPIQPVLINIPDTLPNPRTTEVYNNPLAGHHHEHSKLTPIEALSSLLELPHSTVKIADMQYPKASIRNAVKPIIDREFLPIAKEVIHSPEACASLLPEPLFEAALRAEEYLKQNSPFGKGSSTEREAGINTIAGNAGRVLSKASAAKLEVLSEGVPENNPSSENFDPQDSYGMEKSAQEVKKASKASKSKGWEIVPRKHPSQRVPFKHNAIPPRMSSLEKSIPISRETFRNVLNRDNIIGQLVSKDGGRVQSMSSKTSSMINSSIAQHSQTLGNGVDENRLVEPCDSDIGSQLLQELLYGEEPYRARLTEIPPRKHRLPRITTQCSASQSGTVIMADKRLKELNLRVSQTFIRTIDDLENLMSEALQIARQAAERQNTGKLQGILNDTTASHDLNKQNTYSMRRFSSVFRPRVANMLSYQESVRESAFSASSNSLSLYNDGDKGPSTYAQSERSSKSSLEKRHIYEHANPIKPQRIVHNGKRTHNVRQPYEEDVPTRIKTKRHPKAVLNKREVTEFIRVFHQPPIQSRHSSLTLRKTVNTNDAHVATASAVDLAPKLSSREIVSLRSKKSSSHHTLSTSQTTVSEVDFRAPPEFRKQAGPLTADTSTRIYELKDSNEGEERLPKRHISGRRLQEKIQHLRHDKFSHLNLRHRSHISLRDHKGFSLSRSHRRQPIARDWSPGRKRFAATVACISTALIGMLVGIYAGEVPSIQYYIADFYHYAILGNVCFFITLAVTTFLFWPLPLLHGRKPYILAALTIAMPLLFPQAIAVSIQRSPYVATWRVALILPRTLMGAALGFANINFMATLTDLFGASLQSSNPHQEVVDELDVRRHGGGLGVWLGIWTWCYIGSIGVGFLIGAVVINTLSPDWGFYVSIIIIATVLLLNVVTPEVRRSPYRRSVAEVRNGKEISRRLARGEVMMHRLQTGPKWWGEEFHQGVLLSLDMLRQPGFLVMSLYVSWMYGQVVLVVVLLGSLMSKYYHFTSPAVGATTMAIPLGALLAVPFQKASLFSRARRRPQRTDSMTFDRKVSFSSHLVRRAIFTTVLPFAGLAYTLSSAGPPTPFILPILFSGLIGFLSNLAIAECNGILMETFDTSDLQPGMTGRPRGSSGERTKHKRTNYSSFPRVSSAFAIIQAFGFLIGAAATGVGGVAERHIGQQAATGVMAGILLVLTIGVLGVLYRFKEVQIIPTHNEMDMATWEKERKMSFLRQEEAVRQGAPDDPTPELEEPWRPVIIGNPSGKTRRMSILELGHLSRWSEIRQKNKLIDEMSYEARHPNLATLEDVRKEIRDKNLGSLRRGASQRSRRSQLSQGSEEPYAESEDVGERAKST